MAVKKKQQRKDVSAPSTSFTTQGKDKHGQLTCPVCCGAGCTERPTTLEELYEVGYRAGIRAAANMASQYDAVTEHKYRLEDSILLKFNLVTKADVQPKQVKKPIKKA